jgi:predicted CoA-substrate-specific enzyme activase
MTDTQSIGIDIGSTTVKLVGVDSAGNMLWFKLEQTEPKIEEQVTRLLKQSRKENDYPNDVPIIATGYGRGLATQATRAITEITCHARGAYREFGHGGVLIDIGGQDSKVIRIAPTGKVIDFAMNDKCAAGTGRFLENTAKRLATPLEKMGQTAMETSVEAPISSTCTVFAESEIVSLIARGIPVPEILRGLHRSLIKRVAAMVHSIGLEAPLMLSGGVAQNPLIASMLGEELGAAVLLPRYPQLIGALGAALMIESSQPKPSVALI